MGKNKNILICIPCLLTGGTEVQTLSLVKALISSSYKVTTLCYFEYSEDMVARYKKAGSSVICLSPERTRAHGAWRTIHFLYKGFKRTLGDKKYDLAHVQYMAPGAIPIILLRILGIKKIIATAHTMADIYPSLKLIHFIQRYILTAFTCITLKAEESFFGSASLYTPEIKLKKRGNHFTIYNNLPDYIQIAQRPRSFGNVITIGVVSRLEYIKGMDLVVPAFKEIHRQFSNTRFLIVGDGSLRKHMEEEINKADLYSCASMVGRQPQEKLQSYYDQIDILLVPSRSEGFGLTALEGMARGCIVIASKVGGLPEIIDNIGFLHIPENIDSIVKSTSKLIENKRRFGECSHNALKRAATFSTKTYQQHISTLYKYILS